MAEPTSEPVAGACADPSCPVLHADPANPIHPPDYVPGGPMWDDVQYRCPCSTRTLEAQDGTIVWRATDKDEWCGNLAQPFTTQSGEVRPTGWCEDCITKVCEWCRND